MLWRCGRDIGACAHDVGVQVSTVSSLPLGVHGLLYPFESRVEPLHGLGIVSTALNLRAGRRGGVRAQARLREPMPLYLSPL